MSQIVIDDDSWTELYDGNSDQVTFANTKYDSEVVLYFASTAPAATLTATKATEPTTNTTASVLPLRYGKVVTATDNTADLSCWGRVRNGASSSAITVAN